MPQIFKVGSFVIYFWSNGNNPIEPIHVHVSEGKAVANSTKIWITNTGKALLCNNNSKIPNRMLKNIDLDERAFTSQGKLLVAVYSMGAIQIGHIPV